jgi:protein-S-isoprenylcysteine O-methyltransferase Ste14
MFRPTYRAQRFVHGLRWCRALWDLRWRCGAFGILGGPGGGRRLPIAPPQRLVVGVSLRTQPDVCWIFHWVDRIVGDLWAGQPGALSVAVVAVASVGLFARFYEEPALRQKFGADYQEYCRNVRRWIPRLRAWTKASASNA